MYLASKKSVKAVMTPETPVRNGKPEKVIFRKIREGDMTILERKGGENVKGVSGHEKDGQGNKPAPVWMDSRLFELALSSSPSIGVIQWRRTKVWEIMQCSFRRILHDLHDARNHASVAT